MAARAVSDKKIRARFSHMGLVVKDIAMMEDFYTNVIGFERTDGGMTGQGVTMIFMTLDPEEHHQVFLVEGRPDDMPTNTLVPGARDVSAHFFGIRSEDHGRDPRRLLDDVYDRP